ncbi:MAG: acetyl-CoA carboxylase biotin carboxylase subunit [Planctomycetota bacterium]|jgi:acetyl-CoA carboxylase biotin carboxylase subunit
MFKRILIANRGEIALRVIRACRTLGIESVAAYSEADVASPHLAEADARVCIGPAKSAGSYLNMEAIIQAAEQNGCSAIHPGYGFLAENALFAKLCEQAKMTFIGPPAGAIQMMGDKATARETMRDSGLPVIPGSRGTLSGVADGLELAQEIGFPVLLKATAGGGGKGMRRVDAAGEFEQKFAEASLEAEKAFSNPGLYMEKYIVDGRHIEFQIMADAFGNVVHLSERECSAQRRHQKLVEESPSPVVDDTIRDDLGGKLRVAMRSIGYRNAGTVEFFRDPDGHLYFMEVNARLQVEHPVTEQVTGRDLVLEQIHVAANEPLSFGQDDIRLEGHSIECRINAEDPFDDFRPSPGEVTEFVPPAEISGVKVRVDSHVQAGYRVPVYYDSLIAKLIIWGPTRDKARQGMIEALEAFRVEGVKTTIPVHLKIMQDPDFAAGNYDTGFLARLLGEARQEDETVTAGQA